MKYLTEWYEWMFLTLFCLGGLATIVCMTFAIHPMEIRIYANDQLVETAKITSEMQKNINYNDCVQGCANFLPDFIPDCLERCDGYYDEKNIQ